MNPINLVLNDSAKLADLGISKWGFTNDQRPDSFNRYQDWILKDFHGDLNYLGDHRMELRESFKKYFPEYQQALVFIFPFKKFHFGFNYFLKKTIGKLPLKIASYTLAFKGRDYHHVIGESLNQIGDFISQHYPRIIWKKSIDMHPIMERDLAYLSGLGWFGKNSMLINRQEGSFFLIGSLLLSEKIVEDDDNRDKREFDHCGSCTACIDACPTNAIDSSSRTIIANKCISTFTIETFKPKPPPEGFTTTPEIFGCDICQDVCPWNKKEERKFIFDSKEFEAEVAQNTKLEFLISFFFQQSLADIYRKITEMTKSSFRKSFLGTSFYRTGKKGLLKNL